MTELQEWLTQAGGFGGSPLTKIGLVALTLLIFASLLSSLFISYLYRVFYGSRATGSAIQRAFPLIGISVTTIFVAIQFSLPLSLGLLGALSIVRFRTPVKEPEEIGFILLVVSASLCCATFNLALLGVLLTLAVVALVILRAPWISASLGNHGTITISLPSDRYQEKAAYLHKLLADAMPGGELDAISERDGLAIVTFSFRRMENEQFLTLRGLIADADSDATTSVFYHRPSDI